MFDRESFKEAFDFSDEEVDEFLATVAGVPVEEFRKSDDLEEEGEADG